MQNPSPELRSFARAFVNFSAMINDKRRAQDDVAQAYNEMLASLSQVRGLSADDLDRKITLISAMAIQAEKLGWKLN